MDSNVSTQNTSTHFHRLYLYLALCIGICIGLGSIYLITQANALGKRVPNTKREIVTREEADKIINTFENSLQNSKAPSSLPLLLKETEMILRKGAKNEREREYFLMRLEKAVDSFYEKNLDTIARNLAKNGNLQVYKKAFDAILESKLKVQANEDFLKDLKNSLIAKKGFRLDDSDFQAYVYARHLLDGGKVSTSKGLDASTMKELESVEKGRRPKDENIIEDTAKLGRIFSMLEISPWKPEDLTFMRRSIVTEKLGESTLYTRAYLTAYWMFANKPISERVLLRNTLKHEIQKQGLSCEANSYAHFYNYYAGLEKQPLTDELTVLGKFPKDTTPLKLIRKPDGGFDKIWGDPDTHFVGDTEGSQSVNSNRLTGYGIHAKGVLPLIDSDLRKIGYTAYDTEFNEFEITWNLLNNHPIYFWYVLSLEKKDGFAPLVWKTPSGKNITGYVGEHTGIIVGATYKTDGSIDQVGYYEGRQPNIVWESYETLEKKAKLFNAAIIARQR